jgi:hypothetical protein
VIFFGAAVLAARALAAPPVLGTAFQSVKISGQRIGTEYTPGEASLEYTIAYDQSSGLYHLWCFTGSRVDKLATIRHATSSDGINFTATGNLSYASPPNFAAFGASGEPDYQFPRVVLYGGTWKLLLWTPNAQTSPSPYGGYNYNESANDLGASPSTLAVGHQGPVIGGTFGQTTGWYGLIASSLFVQYDNVGGIGRFSYTDGVPPSVPGLPNATKDLVTGTGYVYGLVDPLNPLAVYPHNSGRTIDLGGRLGTFYSLRRWSDGSRIDKQIYYVESADGGATWTSPVGLFADGNTVIVDGALNAGNFSLPDIAMSPCGPVFYFSTTDSQGRLVVATNAATACGTTTVPTLSGTGLVFLGALLGFTALGLLRRAA